MTSAWVMVVPVKRLDVAKSRLSADVGGHRQALALAMALDTIDVAASCRGVRVVVVTDDDAVAAALRPAGVQVHADEPKAGINAAIVHGARSAAVRSDESIAALAADLPALRAGELGLALHRASSHPQSFVPDAAGTGTTLYAASDMAWFAPRFGSGSAAMHTATAVQLRTDGLSSLRQDVDTIEDLRTAARLGLHERTAQVVARLAGSLDLSAVRPAS